MSFKRRAQPGTTTIRAFRLMVLAVGMLFFGLGMSGCTSPSENEATNSNVTGYKPLPENKNSLEPEVVEPLANTSTESPELAHFTHNNEYHARLSCLICHRRDSNASRISFPGKQNHSPCIGCHTQQFADKKSTICTICHTDPESGALKRFPRLRSFGVKFVHSKHLRVASCAKCHKSTGTGVAYSIPSGSNAHATCFQCHTSKASHNLSSCDVCHQRGRTPAPVRIFRTAYARSFSHAKHRELACSECHSTNGSRTIGKQVSAPAAVMHFPTKGVKSCASCHNDERTFGGEDFSNCKRCHLGNTFKFPKQKL